MLMRSYVLLTFLAVVGMYTNKFWFAIVTLQILTVCLGIDHWIQVARSRHIRRSVLALKKALRSQAFQIVPPFKWWHGAGWAMSETAFFGALSAVVDIWIADPGILLPLSLAVCAVRALVLVAHVGRYAAENRRLTEERDNDCGPIICV